MTAVERSELAESGYLVLPGYMSPALLRELRERVDDLFAEEGERAGSEFKQEPGARRLANLVDKGEVFQRVILMPEILEGMAAVLGPGFKLSSLNVRSSNPYSNTVQPLHADSGAVADEKGYWVCNSVWMLDAFTEDNGAIRIVPGSHRWRRLPQEVLPDPHAPHPEEILVTGPAGAVVIMNAHMWHGATANRTAFQRRALHAFYTRRDKPQQQYQKALLRSSTQESLSRDLRDILALDDPLNDELCLTGSGRSGFMK